MHLVYLVVISSLSYFFSISSHHSIEHLLARYGLLAEHIPQKEFMHSLHNRGECTLSIVKETMDSHSIAEVESMSLNFFDDIYLIKITIFK